MLLIFSFFAGNKNVKTKSNRRTKRTSNRNRKSRNTKKRIEKKELEKLEIKKTDLARKIAIEEIETLRIPIEKSEDIEKNRTCPRKTRKIRYRNRKSRKWRISTKTRNSKRYDKR